MNRSGKVDVAVGILGLGAPQAGAGGSRVAGAPSLLRLATFRIEL